MILATINPWLAFWVLMLAFVTACVWTAVSIPLGILIGRMLRERRIADQQTASDHAEPTREQVEWEMHVAEAVRLTQADVDAIVAWDELEFAAAVLADIDELPGDGAA